MHIKAKPQRPKRLTDHENLGTTERIAINAHGFHYNHINKTDSTNQRITKYRYKQS